MPNIFDPPAAVPACDEHVETLASGLATRVERIVSHGHASAEGFWYDQDQDEWVVLLQGTASLRCDDGSIVALSAGDWLLIPAHERHRVEHTSSDPPCIWIAVHADLRCSGWPRTRSPGDHRRA